MTKRRAANWRDRFWMALFWFAIAPEGAFSQSPAARPRAEADLVKLFDQGIDDAAIAGNPKARYPGLVRVEGSSLPAAGLVILTPPGTDAFAIRAEALRSSQGYGRDMPAPPGRYDLWVEPADGGKAERIAEAIEVVAGKLTAVDRAGQPAPARVPQAAWMSAPPE